ncbi:MAG: type IX secretion system membrane protein PorP/SprF [Bacteroidia bacterium]|nr:type IX secretion system membrane protein PorP/SprF [Bacteroidia bacterium]
MLFSLSCFGQQLPLFTQYHDLQSVINPAAITSDYFALDHNVSIGASYRTQWVGINNNPQTQVLRGDYFNADGAGFSLLAGGSVMNDQTGPTGFTGIYGKIGGVISGDPAYEGLSLALNLGMVQYRVDITEIKFRDENDILAMENQAEVFMDAGLVCFITDRLDPIRI